MSIFCHLFQVYTTENEWDCVSTCFFIDCANNILSFIEVIYKILRPGIINFFVVKQPCDNYLRI